MNQTTKKILRFKICSITLSFQYLFKLAALNSTPGSADEVNYDSVAEILEPKPKPKPTPKPQVQVQEIKPENLEPIIKTKSPSPITHIPDVLENNPDLKEKLDRLALLEAQEVKRRRTPLREAPAVPQVKSKEEEEIEKLRGQIAALEAKNRAHEVGDLRFFINHVWSYGSLTIAI